MAKKILVCDDDDLLREFYSRVIITQGFESLTAVDGEDGLAVIEENANDIGLIIMDLLMPKRNGWEVIDIIQKSPKLKHIPIIAISGLAASLKEFAKVKDVCKEVINKGEFNLSDFVELIKKYVLD